VAGMTEQRVLAGSDLRSRTEVVQWLERNGGEVYDKTGLVASRMRNELGRGRALTQLLAEMEADGMIERDVRGRRTMCVKLLDDWGLTSRPALQVVPDHQDDAGDVSVPGDVDLTQLAEALLAIVVKRASTPLTTPSETRELTKRTQRAERDLEKAVTEVRDLRAARREAEERVAALQHQVDTLEHNLGVVKGELMKSSRNAGGVSIKDRLGAEERAVLDQLMRSLPETRTSKPRKR
jgi:hypothetical protein